MKEQWKDIEFYEGHYQVSNLGRVKSMSRFKVCGRGGKQFVRTRILSQTTTHKGKGYRMVVLCKGGIVKYKTVHRLVGKAFIINNENKPQINHKNGSKVDNRVANLEWCYPVDNMRHARRNGMMRWLKGAENPQAKLREADISIIVDRIAAGEIQRSLAKEYRVSEASISMLKTGKTWKHVKR